jgi:hypothetical protein
VNGAFVAMELKNSVSEVPDEMDLQGYKLSKINDAGGFGLYVYPENFEKVLIFLQTLSKGERYDRDDMGTN